MIPKIIHYCWFGRGQMPELALKCIESWHKYLPEYEYKLWNEDTFDINSVPYVKEAYEARKFAFVTDYIRLWALNKFGGVYMDTDVEILRPLDEFLKLPAFTGYEGSLSKAPVTGLMASAAGGIWVQEQLAYYDGRHFKNEDGTLDLTTNTVTIAKIMTDNGFVIDGKYGVYKNDMHVFPVDYFCPLTSTRELNLTANSACIHHFAGSWVERTPYQKFKQFVCDKIIGHKLTVKLVKIKRLAKSVGGGKILIVGNYPIDLNCIKGGVEASVYGLATELAKEHSVVVLDMPRIGVKDSNEHIDGVTVYRFNLLGNKNIDAIKSLSKYVQIVNEIKPSVCHLHGTGIFNELLYRKLTELGVPTVITVHGILDVEQKNALDKKFTLKRFAQWRYQRFFERKLLKECSQAIVDTGYVKSMINSLGLKRVPEMHIIPQGISEDFFSIQHRRNMEHRIVLSVGGFGQRKGHLYTMKAFDMVAGEIPNVELVIAGCMTDPIYMNKMLRLKNELPSGDRIAILPNVERSALFDLYAKASIFALHSEEESQGIVFAEAMAAGLPIVATNVGGIPYVVHNGINGLLSDFSDVNTFAANINRLLSDATLSSAINKNNIQEAKNYNWKKIADSVIGVYERVMS